MSTVVYGERLYGQVERVAGDHYIATQFFHVNYLPLFPLRSYVVLDGSERNENFRGAQIAMHWKSVVIGYLRGWIGAVAVVAMFCSGFTFALHLSPRGPRSIDCFALGMGLAVALGGIALYVMWTKSLLHIAAQAVLWGVAFTWWLLVVSRAGDLQGEARDNVVNWWWAIPIGLAALLGYSLLRCFTMARGRHDLDERFDPSGR